MSVLDDLNIAAHQILEPPEAFKQRLPVGDAAAAAVQRGRRDVKKVLTREDPRLLVVLGPCSIHDVDAARDYAERLAGLAPAVSDQLLLVMRAYFEKPRTTVGWKGLINDPHLDDSFRVAEGLEIARRLLLDLAAMGLPLATEALDPITPQYLQDLISWSAIGARTTESQTHREMASGLSCAVGFKNGTDGSLDVAINALQSVASPHRFLGINPDGRVAVIHTRGNAHGHVVLRGGSGGPNYEPAHLDACAAALTARGLTANIMVDCSHANSSKDHERQALVARAVMSAMEAGNRAVMGLMLESHLEAGRQDLAGGREALRYGVSVTDACIDWDTTEALVRELADRMGRLDRRPEDRRSAG